MTEDVKPEVDIIHLKNVRISFPHIFKKGIINGKENDKFSAHFLIAKDEDSETSKLIKSKIKEMLDLKNKGAKLSAEKYCLTDGDAEGQRAEYNGHFKISASTDARPIVVDRKMQPITEEDNLIYAGCRVNAQITLWWQNNKSFGKRVNANLVAVQYVRDDDPLGSGRLDIDTVLGGFEDLSNTNLDADDTVEDDDPLL